MRGVVLNISYKSRELMHICTKIEEAQRHLGPQVAAGLLELLAEAESFLNAGELIDFRDGELLGGDSLSIAFSADYRATFEAVGDDLPRGKSGGIAWGQVRRIMLIEIAKC